jgi:hypothetical protein
VKCSRLKEMNSVMLVLLFAAACTAGEPGKAACNSHNTGRLRPEAANSDWSAARRTAQTGELEVCSFTGWRYKWKPVTVSVARLSKGKNGAGTTPAKAVGGQADEEHASDRSLTVAAR